MVVSSCTPSRMPSVGVDSCSRSGRSCRSDWTRRTISPSSRTPRYSSSRVQSGRSLPSPLPCPIGKGCVLSSPVSNREGVSPLLSRVQSGGGAGVCTFLASGRIVSLSVLSSRVQLGRNTSFSVLTGPIGEWCLYLLFSFSIRSCRCSFSCLESNWEEWFLFSPM